MTLPSLTPALGSRGPSTLESSKSPQYSFTGRYASFQRHLRLFRPALVREPEIRFETDPGGQTQTDWAHVGVWPVGGEPRELFALVSILGYSRRPAVRFALDRTRTTTLTRLALTLDDLGGAELLGMVPKACRPYRDKTKGRVERRVREVKESFMVWLTGRAPPPMVSLADYDALAAQWIRKRVLPRRHRTTGLVVDITRRLAGEHVQVPDLAEYEVAQRVPPWKPP